MFKRGTKYKIRWMAHHCLSSLTKISDLSTLLRPATSVRLSLGATCLLYVKTSKEKARVNIMKSPWEMNGIQKEWRNIKPRGYCLYFKRKKRMAGT